VAVEPTSAETSQDLVSAAPSDRCANCGSPLAPDQRYCVECGERRGTARFSFESLAVPKAAAPAAPKKHRRPRISSSFSFILGVATLLLALGVGVLIGHNTNTPKQTAAATPSQTIKVEGLGGSNGSTGNASTRSASTKKAFKAPKVPKLTTVQVHKANAAVSTVLGSGTRNLSQNPTQQVGGSCSGGNGCQNGKFTGNFFGGG
jgi:hypothetical protein